MTRALPLTKRFPGQTVLRAKVWFSGSYSAGIEGPAPREVGCLVVAMMCSGRLSPKQLAKIARLTDELQGTRPGKSAGGKRGAK